VLKLVDPLVDLSMTGHLKPDPRAYAEAIKAMQADPGDIVFLDDQPANIAGAIKAGIVSVFFDPTDVASSVKAFRHALAGK
jgi:putative hydrolase of the HAD superfamily